MENYADVDEVRTIKKVGVSKLAIWSIVFECYKLSFSHFRFVSKHERKNASLWKETQWKERFLSRTHISIRVGYFMKSIFSIIAIPLHKLNRVLSQIDNNIYEYYIYYHSNAASVSIRVVWCIHFTATCLLKPDFISKRQLNMLK